MRCYLGLLLFLGLTFAAVLLASCQQGLPPEQNIDYLVDELKPPAGTAYDAVVVLFTVGGSAGHQESTQAMNDAQFETGPKVAYLTINLYSKMDVARQYGVHGTPSFIFFDKEGKLKSKVINNVMTKDQILTELRNLGWSK